jgi:hypothetical protein
MRSLLKDDARKISPGCAPLARAIRRELAR